MQELTLSPLSGSMNSTTGQAVSSKARPCSNFSIFDRKDLFLCETSFSRFSVLQVDYYRQSRVLEREEKAKVGNLTNEGKKFQISKSMMKIPDRSILLFIYAS